ncbi:hypothetical protein PtA15_13A392 [Puccinia triticina]|uniref:OPT family small oligopeptide transporter n=1 Tax=Puccinia triticina TaxID=208348 RepID=A0ABY7D3Y7_9BASI|nr:uncharacterized protein PtA15_13A392 [Puccinia triticina]WAQ90992.1 hypothetical protein PtA15_13A392 [Puccinia triticina]WAR61181.1 hypothetical protein PtB15_13B433 [Puccinia triticina]
MGTSEKLLKDTENTSALDLVKNEDQVQLQEKTQIAEDSLPIITFRSVLVGIIVSAFGATCAQIFIFKPIVLHVHSLFIQVRRYYSYVPLYLEFKQGSLMNFKTYYDQSQKETTFSSIMACSASAGAITSVEMIGARSLLFNQNPEFFVSLLVMLSSQLIGYGISGLLRPILVYPSKMVFPSVLPSVVLFKSMYSRSPESRDQISFFKKALLGIGLYEFFPIYMAPALQAVSPWCLTLPKKAEITQLFGGSMVGEGLGFLSLSLDWTIIGAHGPLYTPLDAQWNLLIAHIGAIFLFSAAYKYNWLGGGSMPFISFELLDHNGNSYNTAAIINIDGTENAEAVEKLGLPFFSSAYIIGKACMCLATAAAFTAAILQNWRTIKDLITRKQIETDPHRLTCKKFKDFPMWAFVVLLVFSIALAFIASYLNKSGLSAWGLTSAIVISALLSGSDARIWILNSVTIHIDAKRAQTWSSELLHYQILSTSSLNIPKLKYLLCGYTFDQMEKSTCTSPRWPAHWNGNWSPYKLCCIFKYFEREALLKPEGNSAFSGMHLTSFEAQSVTWGIFGKRLYGAGKRYSFVPWSLVAGFLLPIPFHFLQKYAFKYVFQYPIQADSIHPGLTSGATMKLIIGFMSQFYMKKYHKSWYDKYNYILSAALDGGTQMAILICTFLFQGGAGLTVPFPNYFLNPGQGPRDYCYNNVGK